MAISERIHFFRLMRGMTQKYLGTAIGFPEKSADVRLAQYETGTRKPKADLTNALAQVLDVSPQALDVPDIDSYIGLMHTLFTLEDIYGLTVSEADGEVCLKVNKDKGREAYELLKMLYAWKEQADKLSSEEINREEYDNWRYHYPEFDTTQRWAKVPSQELSDALVDLNLCSPLSSLIHNPFHPVTMNQTVFLDTNAENFFTSSPNQAFGCQTSTLALITAHIGNRAVIRHFI